MHCWWKFKLVQSLWETVWKFLKKLKIELPYDPATLLLGIYPETKNKNTNSKRYVHPNIHSGITYNRKNMEVIQVSINRRMDKEDIV